MRIATATQFDTSIAALQKRQQAMQDSQQQLTTGKKIAKASDDPTGAARAERALASMGRIDANQRALEASRNGMTLSEGALGDANELMQQVRETMVAAGNASYSDAERAGLATKVAGLRDQLLSIANRGDGAGGFLFSGQGSGGPPFLDQAGGVSFTGVSGSIESGNSDKFALTIDGRQAWEQARSGNGSFETGALPNQLNPADAAKGWIDSGRVVDPALLSGHNYKIQIAGTAPVSTYSVTDTELGGTVVNAGSFKSGQAISFDGMAMTISGSPANGDQFEVKPSTNSLKVFDVLDQAITDLKKPSRSSVEITQSNTNRLRDLDAVMGNLQTIRSQVGEQMNNLDGAESRMAGSKLYNQSERSAAEDLDMVAGISDFQNQQTGYDAALKTYAMVQRMSLLQYINA